MPIRLYIYCTYTEAINSNLSHSHLYLHIIYTSTLKLTLTLTPPLTLTLAPKLTHNSRPKNIPQPPRHRKPPRRLHHLHRNLPRLLPRHLQMDRHARRCLERPNRHRPGARHLRRLGARRRQQPVVRPGANGSGPGLEGNRLAGRKSCERH